MTMKTIKVADATNTQLDWLVTNCELGRRLADGEHVKPWVQEQILNGLHADPYTSDPAQMWPIIEREHISTYWNTGEDYCRARVAALPICTTGHTSLIAAARCYITSKLGETVEVPEELA